LFQGEVHFNFSLTERPCNPHVRLKASIDIGINRSRFKPTPIDVRGIYTYPLDSYGMTSKEYRAANLKCALRERKDIPIHSTQSYYKYPKTIGQAKIYF